MDIYQKILDTTYDETLASLELGLSDKNYSLTTIINELDNLHKFEGLDWIGRGELKQAEIEGRIWAYTAFINRQKLVLDKNKSFTS